VHDLEAMLARCASLAPEYYGVLLYKAHLASVKGDSVGAQQFMEAAISANPGHVHFYGARGLHWLRSGRYAEAYKDLRYFQDRAGDAPVMPSWCIPSYIALRKLDEASALIETTLKDAGTRFVMGLDTWSLALYYKGAIQRARGDTEGARESFLQARASLEKSLAEFPESVTLRSWLAVLLVLCGDGPGALAEADRVQRENPEYVQLAYQKSLICAALHDKQGLLSWLAKLNEQGALIWWGVRNDIGFAEYADDPDFIAVAGGTRVPVSAS
jgi:tetratricopeptide (TPR) repeat protein